MCAASVAGTGCAPGIVRPEALDLIVARVSPPPTPTITKAKRVEVQYYTPERSGRNTRSITVTFNQPMEERDLLVVEPPVEGQQIWLGPQVLALISHKPLPRATRYLVRIEQGARAQSGNVLQEEFAWTFATERPELRNIEPAHETLLPSLRSPLVLSYNQPVDLNSIRTRVGLTRRAQKHKIIPFAVRYAHNDTGEKDRTRVEIVPRDAIPPGARLELTIQTGVRGAEGNLQSRRSHKHVNWAPGPPAMVSSSCTPSKSGQCARDGEILLSFTTDLAPESAEALVISPRLPKNQISVEGRNISIRGPFQPKTSYKIQAKTGIKDRQGQGWGKTWAQRFQIEADPPSLDSLEWISRPNLHIRATRTSQVSLQSAPVPQHKLIATLANPEDASFEWTWSKTLKISPSRRKKGFSAPIPSKAMSPSRGSVHLLRASSKAIQSYQIWRIPHHKINWWPQGEELRVSVLQIQGNPAPHTPLTLRDAAGKTFWKGSTDSRGEASIPAWDFKEKSPWYLFSGSDLVYTYQKITQRGLLSTKNTRSPHGEISAFCSPCGPNGKIHLQGFFLNGDRQALSKEPLELQIESPSESIAINQEITLSPHGALQQSLSLPMEEGTWTVRAFHPSFDKPVHTSWSTSGDPVSAKLEIQDSAILARIQQGGTASLSWSLRLKKHPFSPSSLPGYVFGPEKERRSPHKAKTLRGTLNTGDDGKSVLTTAPQWPSRDLPTQVAWKIAGQEDLQIHHRRDLYPGLLLKKRLYQEGERVEVKVLASSLDGVPQKGHELRTTLEQQEKGAWTEKAVCRFQSQDQPTKCGFVPKNPGMYRIRVTGKDQQKRPIETTQRIWLQPSKSNLDLDLMAPEVILERDLKKNTLSALLLAPAGTSEISWSVTREGKTQKESLFNPPSLSVLGPYPRIKDEDLTLTALFTLPGSAETTRIAHHLPGTKPQPTPTKHKSGLNIAQNLSKNHQIEINLQGAPQNTALIQGIDARGDSLHRTATLDAEGKASLFLPTPSSSGPYKVRALFPRTEGDALHLEEELDARLPLDVRLETPPEIVEGDVFDLHVAITNHESRARSWNLRLKELDRPPRTVFVAPQSTQILTFPLRHRASLPKNLTVLVQDPQNPEHALSRAVSMPRAHPENRWLITRGVANTPSAIPGEPGHTLSWSSRLPVHLQDLHDALTLDHNLELNDLWTHVLGWSVLSDPNAAPLWSPEASSRAPEQLQKAVSSLLTLQQPEGGFARRPGDAQNHTMGSIFAIWSLHHAVQKGARVPKRTMKRAVNYLTRVLRRGRAPLSPQKATPDELAAAWFVANTMLGDEKTPILTDTDPSRLSPASLSMLPHDFMAPKNRIEPLQNTETQDPVPHAIAGASWEPFWRLYTTPKTPQRAADIRKFYLSPANTLQEEVLRTMLVMDTPLQTTSPSEKARLWKGNTPTKPHAETSHTFDSTSGTTNWILEPLAGPVFYTLRSPAPLCEHPSIQLLRSYHDPETGEPLSKIKKGEEVLVSLILVSPHDLAQVRLKDTLPSGLHVVEATRAPIEEDLLPFAPLRVDAAHHSAREVELTLRHVTGGVHSYTYKARANWTGSFQALAPRLQGTYDASLCAEGKSETFKVLP